MGGNVRILSPTGTTCRDVSFYDVTKHSVGGRARQTFRNSAHGVVAHDDTRPYIIGCAGLRDSGSTLRTAASKRLKIPRIGSCLSS